MKHLGKLLLASMMALTLIACGTSGSAGTSAPEGKFPAGTYEGEAAGFGGDKTPIKVKVTLSSDKIESIEFTADGETPTIGGEALPKLVDAVLESQSTNIDVVSGATITSEGFIQAVNAALEAAGVDPAALQSVAKEEAAPENVEKTADVVIAGAGGAGMTAAITAAQNGKSVIILEKAAVVGGNSSYATGGMNAAETHYQKEEGIEDSVQLFYDDTMKGGHDLNNPELVQTLAENSSAAIDWLDSINAPLANVGQAGGASVKRQHRPVDADGKILSVGTYLVEHLHNKVDELGIEIITDAKVDEVLMDGNKAVGLHATTSKGSDIVVKANSVIITTGGFGSNPELIVKYRPDLKGYVSTNAPSITGDAIAFLEAIKADFVDLDQIQIHPTVVQKDGSLITESLRGDGAILLNSNGQRFCNETLTRDVVSANIIEQDGGSAWLIVDETMKEGSTVIQKYIDKGYMIPCDSVKALADLIGCDEANVQESIDKWAAAVAAGADAEFERGNFDAMLTDLSKAPYYAVQISPGIHHCMGGVKINASTQVIGTDGNPIENLYAAGEVTGGVHGGNRLGGNAVSDFVVFGRIAGEQASK